MSILPPLLGTYTWASSYELASSATSSVQHLSKYGYAKKKAIFEIACPEGVISFSKTVPVTVSRYGPLQSLPAAFPSTPLLNAQVSQTMYQYPQPQSDDEFIWHVNFADYHLFGFHSSTLFAQDEIMAAEHPVLGPVRTWLMECPKVNPGSGLQPYTRLSQRGKPTPVLIMGAERKVHVQTDPNELECRPYGLYGHSFAGASVPAVQKATLKLSDSFSNIIAMEAPKHGSGVYQEEEVLDILVTAVTAFAGAVLESQKHLERVSKESQKKAKVAIHTGLWGTGAFGGNRVMMSLLQFAAARLAGIDQLVFHGFDKAGVESANEGFKRLFEIWPVQENGKEEEQIRSQEFVQKVLALGLRWGVSSGE